MDETREVVLTGEEATRYLAEQQAKAPTTLTARDLIHDAANPSKQELQQGLVVDRITKAYDMIRMRRLDTYYIREKQSPSFTFRRACQQDLENLVRDTYVDLHLMPTAKKVKDTVETIKTMVKEEMDNLTNTVEVVPGLYWDNTQSDALTQRPETPCLRRLFDNGSYSSPAIITIHPTDSLVGDAAKSYVKSVYNNTLRWLDTLGGTLPSLTDYEEAGGVGDRSIPVLFSFPFIYTWACDNHDLYMDMLKAACTIFMKNKPKKVFALTGLKRNGKSNLSNSTQVLVRDVNSSIIPHWKDHGKIVPGDEVLSWRGRFRKVVATVQHTPCPFYRLTLQDGRTIEAGEDHLWSVVPVQRLGGRHPRVRDKQGRPTNKRYTIPIKRYDPDMWETKSTKELLVDYRGPDTVSKEGWRRKDCRYYLPAAMPVELPEQELPIDPYALGVIIGDASIDSKGTVRITGMDPTLIEAVTGRVAAINKTKTAKSKACIVNYDGSTVRYKEQLISLGLAGKHSHEKFIPEQYLIGSLEQRYALLRGLLDTDGYITHGKVNRAINQTEFSTTSKRLADQVRSLVFSLGGSATIHERTGRYRLKDGTYKSTRPNYRLFIRTLENPFRLSRKAKCWKPQKGLGYTAITNIEYIGEQSAQCIAIDGDEYTYLATENYIPTHNTYLSMLHTLLGRANTSALKLSELSDAHQTDQLRFTMMNAPDEEASISDMSPKDIANFKSLASHEPIFANKMYSPDASFISSDFPCFMAWNQDPKWKGSGAAACAERTIIIPFNADLSKFDTGGKDFKKETFTVDMFMDLVGVLLALAHYYDNHEMTFSETTMAETNEVNEDVNAPIEYAKLFVKWYAGFDKQSTVFDDFTAWCTQNGYGYQGVTTKDVIFALKKIGGAPKRTNVSINTGITSVQKLPLSVGKSYLAPEQYLPELKNTVGGILWYDGGHSTGNSVTQALEDWLTMQQIPKVERARPDYQREITDWKEENGR